jgi:hypothetical protein
LQRPRTDFTRGEADAIGNNRDYGPEIRDALNSLCELSARVVILILWVSLKGVVGPGYAPLITGVSTTRGNSGNGALPTREPAHGEDQDNAGQ